MAVQSVLFAHGAEGPWTLATARRWLYQRGYAAPEVHVTDRFLRFRQREPEEGARYATAPAEGAPGVQLVRMWPASIGHGAGARRNEQGDDEECPPRRGAALFTEEGETTGEELAAWGAANVPGFLGVVPRDHFAELYPRGAPMPPGTSCVVNLDFGDYDRGGTHWCGVRVAAEQPAVLYYDPFGMPPPRAVAVRSWADGRECEYSDVQYQGLTETNCGPRSLAVLHALAQAAEKGRETAAWREIGQA
jgi:hypothetical protein